MLASSQPTVLVATHDSGCIAALRLFIETLSYRLEAAADSQQCATLATRLRPPLAILDADLPNTDTLALCRQLRAQGTRVLFLSRDDAARVDALFEAGADDYVPKPIHQRLLHQRVQRLLDLAAAQKRAADSERLWHQAFHRSHAVKLLIDATTGFIIDANQAACSFYGYPIDEFRQKRIIDLDARTFSDDDTDVNSTMFNYRHRLANGQERDVKIFSGPLDVNGRTLVYSIIYDNTKRRQAEAAEHDQRAMAGALRQMAAALSSTLDQNELLDRILLQIQEVVQNDCANIMLIDNGVARIVRWRGYDESIASEIQAMEFPIAETANLRWMIEHGRPLLIRDVQTFQGWIPVDANRPIRSHVSAPIRLGNHFIGFLNLDSTSINYFSEHDAENLLAFADQAAVAIRNARLYDRVRRQTTQLERRVKERTAELEFERQQLRAILDAMAEGVAYSEYVDDRIQVRYINQALTSQTGYTVEDWTEHSLALFKEPDVSDDDFRLRIEHIYEALRTQGLWHQEIKMQRKDGTQFDMSTVTTRVDGADGQLIGAVTVTRDVSQERALQAQKTRFVAYASHELRTPITNIKTRLYLLRKQPDKITDHLRVLEEVTDRMQRLVEDLLDISRFERGIIHLKQQTLPLQEVVEKSVSVQVPEAERKGLRLTAEMVENPLFVYIDPERVIQVITNLLTNAINYTPTGGAIVVRVSRVVQDRTHYALVEVIDTGIGIAQEHLPHIFQPFYRVISQVEGTGLGLNISKEIVELHGGSIGVESSPERGSRFYFFLPALPLDTALPSDASPVSLISPWTAG